jgi:mono/diheme cytochrome c family protein
MRIMGIRQTGLFGGMALGLALGGCNSFDKAPTGDEHQGHLVIPVDQRPTVASPVTPPAISGGTLIATADGHSAIVADPDRDRVSIVDLDSLSVRHTIELQPGDEPGRSIEDGQKHIHVALRRGGAVVAIDPQTGSILERRAVCKAPRGIAFEPLTGLLHVACAEGKLVSLPAAGGAAVRTLTLGADLRDVLVRGSELWVTRFKSAEVLRVTSAGVLDKTLKIPQGSGNLTQPVSESDQFGNSFKQVTVDAGTAWRAVSNARGGAVIVHQQGVADEIEVTKPSVAGSAYGGGGDMSGFSCDGIVKNAVTVVAPDGTSVTQPFSGAPLPVDVAVSADQNWVVVAHAGPADVNAPRPSVEFPSEDSGDDLRPVASANFGFPGSGSTVSFLSTANLANGNPCAATEGGGVVDPVTAVAFTSDNRLLMQTREPAQLLIMRELPFGTLDTVALLGDSRLDTGHELFHRDAGGGIACASCHPEGGEDGRTWRFADTGERRTQALHVGLRDTAPFHWAGDLPNVGALMSDVFVGRMGGIRENAPRVSAVSEWLFALKAPPAIRDASDEAALRGQALFQSADVGCATCHSGAKLTNNLSAAIDTVKNTRLQVPSLVAVGYRAPFMHNGCAQTLSARFDPACGGNAHGNTAALSDTQRDDLIAYLESL